MQEAVALLGDYAAYDAFLRVVVEEDGVGIVLAFVLLEEGTAEGAASAVDAAVGMESLGVEVDLNPVGLKAEPLVEYVALAVEVCAAAVDLQRYGILCLVVYYVGDGIGRYG